MEKAVSKECFRVLFVFSSLKTGGIESKIVILANQLNRNGHMVGVATKSDAKGDFFTLDVDIQRIDLGFNEYVRPGIVGRFLNVVGRIKLIRSKIVLFDPDVVISFSDKINVRVLVSLIGCKIPVLACEDNNPLAKHPTHGWRILRRVSYHWAARLVCPSSGLSDVFKWVQSSRRVVIRNPFDFEYIGRRMNEESRASTVTDRFTLLGVGRLSYQKGFDLLLRAFERSCHRHPEWKVVLLGIGPEKENLERLARQLGILDRVIFMGVVQNPFVHMRLAGALVLSSRYEGFGNVIVEAMACSTPVVAFDCPWGPSEIIDHERTGLLAVPDDVENLAVQITRVMTDTELCNSMTSMARRESENRFSVYKIIKQWESLMGEVAT